MTDENRLQVCGQTEINLSIPCDTETIELWDSVILNDVQIPASAKYFYATNTSFKAIHLTHNLEVFDVYNCPNVVIRTPSDNLVSIQVIRINKCGLESFNISGPKLYQVDLRDNQIKCIDAKFTNNLRHLDIARNPKDICIRHLDFLIDANDEDKYPKGDYFSVLTQGEFKDPRNWPEKAWESLECGDKEIYDGWCFNRCV